MKNFFVLSSIFLQKVRHSLASRLGIKSARIISWLTLLMLANGYCPAMLGKLLKQAPQSWTYSRALFTELKALFETHLAKLFTEGGTAGIASTTLELSQHFPFLDLPTKKDFSIINEWEFDKPLENLVKVIAKSGSFFINYAKMRIERDKFDIVAYAILESWFRLNPSDANINIGLHVKSFGKELIQKQGLDSARIFFTELAKIFPTELKEYASLYLFVSDLCRSAQDKTKTEEYKEQTLLLSYSVWGEVYTKLFVDYCIPSLLADGNLPYVKSKRKIRFDLFCTSESKKVIKAAQSFRQLSKICSVSFYIIPDTLINSNSHDYVNGTLKYQIYAALHHVSLLRASCLGADLIAIGPDNLYSSGTIASLFNEIENGFDVVFFSAVRVQAETILPVLDKKKNKTRGNLNISDDELVYLSMQHIHEEFIDYFVLNNNSVEWRSGFFIPKSDGLSVRSFHYHPAIISSRLTKSKNDIKFSFSPLDEVLIDELYNGKVDWDRCSFLSQKPGFLMLDIAFRKAPRQVTGKSEINAEYMSSLEQKFSPYSRQLFKQKCSYKFKDSNLKINSVITSGDTDNGSFGPMSISLNEDISKVENFLDDWTN